MAPLISLSNVNVEIPVFNHVNRCFRSKLFNVAVGGSLENNEKDSVVTHVKALNSITFDIAYGDRIGLLGHNGCGKTTLLKVLSGILEPSSGNIEINIPVTPILSMDIGIDQEMTGYDAIKMGSMLRGQKIENLDDIINDIEEFSELGPFLEMPVRTYSAGMRARLVFGIATSFKPQALIIDEGIGAGDAGFMEKAQKRVEDYISTATILVMASHGMDMLTNFCNKGILMKNGEIIKMGSLKECISMYNNGKY